ncbi:MAG: TrbI/VirB10 family protein [Nanoarchaeota archaeon]
MLFVYTTTLYASGLPTNEVSFEFEEVEIQNVLKSICKANNINLVVPEIDKEISLELKDISFKKSIEVITENNDLGYIFQDNVLIIDYEDEIKENYKLEDEKENQDTNNNKILISSPKEEKKESDTETSQNENDNSTENQPKAKAVYNPPDLIVAEEKKTASSELIIDVEKEDKKEEQEQDNPVTEKEGINKGTLIPARLEIGLVSSTEKTPALVRVTKAVAYEGEVIIPKGSLFTGVGTSDYGVRQIFVDLDTLIIKDREIDIEAHLVKEDGKPGFCSEYRDLEMEKFWPTFLMNFVSSIGNAFKDVTYVRDSDGRKHDVEENTVKNEVIERSQEGVDGWTEQILGDAQSQKAIIYVDAGIEGYVFVDEKIPLKHFKEKDNNN